jgi:hypothetical protein
VLAAALAGWFKLAGVSLVRQRPDQWPDEAADFDAVTILWKDWVLFWDVDAAGEEPPPLPGASVVMTR